MTLSSTAFGELPENCCDESTVAEYELAFDLGFDNPCECPNEDCPDGNCPDCHCCHVHTRQIFQPITYFLTHGHRHFELLFFKNDFYRAPYLEGNKRPPKKIS